MKQKTLKTRLSDYLSKVGHPVHKGDLERLAMSVGYMGDTCGRELRRMAEDGEIKRLEKNGSVLYQTLTPKTKRVLTTTLPTGEKIIIKTIYE